MRAFVFLVRTQLFQNIASFELQRTSVLLLNFQRFRIGFNARVAEAAAVTVGAILVEALVHPHFVDVFVPPAEPIAVNRPAVRANGCLVVGIDVGREEPST